VAHDLKAPLSPIIGYAEVLAEKGEDMEWEELRGYLEIIARRGRKINVIINELLLLASVRKQDVKKRPLDMKEIVEDACQRLEDMIEKADAEIIVPDEWPRALGYALWVEEIWVNYLSNGIKYGGSPPRLELGATPLPSKGKIRFWVRDNGSGLTEEECERLFVPFERLSQVRTQGLGLGLSIVQRIVDKLDGEAGVESELGEGSTFYFTLLAADGNE
jgi:signal transduction histidine kinase